MTTPWPQGPTIELAHALVHRVLTSAETRGLFIKGPAAVAQGLRETTRVSTDVDVRCGPRRAREAISLLDGLGWKRFFGPGSDSQGLGLHAVAVVIPGWPCTVDVHVNFPGLLGAPRHVVDEVWSRHDAVNLAHQSVPCLDRVDHAIILALHALRDVAHDRESEARLSFTPAWAALLPTERDRLAEAARRLGALEPLRASLAACEIPCGAVDARYPAELAHWNRGRKSGGQAGMVWLHRLASRPWHERPRIVLRAFWDISMDKAHTPQEWAAAGRRSRAHGRARRLRRGLGLIPQTSRRWRA